MSAPQPRYAADRHCSPQAPSVRVVLQVSPHGKTRVLMTDLTGVQAPEQRLGGLHHQRPRVNEAFKRLKHRRRLEPVTGLRHHALMVDVVAKIPADSQPALPARAVHHAINESNERSYTTWTNRRTRRKACPPSLAALASAASDSVLTLDRDDAHEQPTEFEAA
jgi:hypothetical protein